MSIDRSKNPLKTEDLQTQLAKIYTPFGLSKLKDLYPQYEYDGAIWDLIVDSTQQETHENFEDRVKDVIKKNNF